MNRKLLTSAVVIHACACLVAFVAIGASGAHDDASAMAAPAKERRTGKAPRSAPALSVEEGQWEPAPMRFEVENERELDAAELMDEQEILIDSLTTQQVAF